MTGAVYTHAMWRVEEGKQEAFVAAWTALGDTFAALPDPPLWGTLIRSTADPTLFYSFGPWSTREHVEAMRSNEGAIAGLERLRSLCVEASPGAYELVRHVNLHGASGPRLPAAEGSPAEPFRVERLTDPTREALRKVMVQRRHAPYVISRGRRHHPLELPGFVAFEGKRSLGLATYRLEGEECELVTIDSWREGAGVGSALLAAVREAASAAGCHRLWLITTNDNLPALRFYQKRGFRLVAVYPDALRRSRELKPQIPAEVLHRIPLRDELELESRLEG